MCWCFRVGRSHWSDSPAFLRCRDSGGSRLDSCGKKIFARSLARSLSDTNFPGADYDVPFHVFGICDAPPPPPSLPLSPPHRSSVDLQLRRRRRLVRKRREEMRRRVRGEGGRGGSGGINRQSQRCQSLIGCGDKQSSGFTGGSDVSPVSQNLQLFDWS